MHSWHPVTSASATRQKRLWQITSKFQIAFRGFTEIPLTGTELAHTHYLVIGPNILALAKAAFDTNR